MQGRIKLEQVKIPNNENLELEIEFEAYCKDHKEPWNAEDPKITFCSAKLFLVTPHAHCDLVEIKIDEQIIHSQFKDVINEAWEKNQHLITWKPDYRSDYED